MRRPKAEMLKIREDFVDFVKRGQARYSIDIMAKMFRVSSVTLSKWMKEEHISRWFC